MLRIFLCLMLCLMTSSSFAQFEYQSAFRGVDFSGDDNDRILLGDITSMDGANAITTGVVMCHDTLLTDKAIIAKWDGSVATTRSFFVGIDGTNSDELLVAVQTGTSSATDRLFYDTTDANIAADTCYGFVAACELTGTATCINRLINLSTGTITTPTISYLHQVGGTIVNSATSAYIGYTIHNTTNIDGQVYIAFLDDSQWSSENIEAFLTDYYNGIIDYQGQAPVNCWELEECRYGQDCENVTFYDSCGSDNITGDDNGADGGLLGVMRDK